MRQYTAAIYADENLLLTELLERLESELPTIGLTIYSTTQAGSDISTPGGEYNVLPVEKFGGEEILIVLSDPQKHSEQFKGFDGSVVDFTGTFAGLMDDVYVAEDPIAYLLNMLTDDPDELDAVATVPAAVFGKSGIDDLLAQTRELFAFTNTETKVFENRLAFNLFFSDPDQGILSGYRQKLKQDTGVDVDVRMIAVSTGFVLDVYFKKDVNSNLTISDRNGRFETLADVIESDSIVKVTETGSRLSFAGDYMHTVSRQIVEALKDITGEN